MSQNKSNIQSAPSGARSQNRAYVLGLALGLLLAGLILGLFYHFLFSRFLREAEVAKVDVPAFQSGNIEALKADIVRYKDLLAGDVCLNPGAAPGLFFFPQGVEPTEGPDGSLVLPQPGGGGIGGGEPATPLGPNLPSGTGPGLAQDPGATPSEDGAKSPTLPPPPNSDTVIGDIEAATVLVLVTGADEGITMGTGFFVANDLIMTNRHVVEGALGGGAILVTNKSLGHIQEAQLVAASQPEQFRDYALLKVSVDKSKAPRALKISQEAKRSDRVSAWGYPGLLTKIDPKMEALLQGDFSAAPELVYAEGVISVVQQMEGGVPLISHTAEVSHGNSGGPLIDQNGRVVGINTFIRVDDNSSRQVNVALGGRDLMQFLANNHVRLD
ncbi:MAG: serine protease [Deltaproteobacteria bacterium]|jgi:S1-C subfamily serine protease|nr:serine protease [Deltaproteobacteria bacterium]